MVTVRWLPDRFSTRRYVYLAVFTATLLAGMRVALLSPMDPSHRLQAPQIVVFGFAIVVAAGLIWLDAKVAPYTLGLMFLMMAFLGFWIASPDGALWMGHMARNSDLALSGTRVFAYVFLFSFPIGWILLAGSVYGWLRAGLSYLGAGGMFILLHMLLISKLPMALLPVYWLFWPHFTLVMLGTFGFDFGSNGH